MKAWAALSAALALTGCVRPLLHPRASLPVFGPGPATNLGSDMADTNAAAHAGWALTFPLAGQAADGRRGRYLGAGAWAAFSLLNEALWHVPDQPGPGYPSEVRTDLLSRLLPLLVALAVLEWLDRR